MALEQVPYTNYHDLNLDWVLKVAKEAKDVIEGDRTEINELKEEMEQAIQAALDSIDMVRVDEDTMVLKVGDRESAPIDDVYVTGVEKTDEPDGTFVNIKRNNGKGDLKVSLDEFEDTKIDGEYF